MTCCCVVRTVIFCVLFTIVILFHLYDPVEHRRAAAFYGAAVLFHDHVDKITGPKAENTTKYLLFYTPFFHWQDWTVGLGDEPFKQCSFTNCHVTNNKSLLGSLNQFDAVLFHLRDTSKHVPRVDRLPNQRYVLFTLESPSYSTNFPFGKYNDFFNWTMTYRRDSDVHVPYGRLRSLETKTDAAEMLEEKVKLVRSKMKLAAWMVSNCHTQSRREEYVKKLQKWMSVDVYGACGTMQCSKEEGESCYRMLDETYKFYISFENAFCDEYVTEKFWEVMNLTSIVPVVMGGGNYSSVAPAGSFVNVADFPSPRLLALYLQHLDRNDRELAKHLVWKSGFRVEESKLNIPRAMCKMCEKLNDDSLPSQWYSNLNEWWVVRSHCRKP